MKSKRGTGAGAGFTVFILNGIHSKPDLVGTSLVINEKDRYFYSLIFFVVVGLYVVFIACYECQTNVD